MGASPHARLAPNRAGCSTCVRSVTMGSGRTRARSLAKAGARAAGTGDAALPRSAAPPIGAQRVHSVPQSTRWPRAARSKLRLMRRRTECAPHWQGSEPELRGTRASIQFSKARSRLRPRGGPSCAGPSAPQPGGSRRGRPLHALACTRRLRTVAKPFTQFQNALARTRPAPIQIGTGHARPPRLPKHRATRCRAPRASCCPLDTLARRRPAAPAVGPRRRSRLAARALDRFTTNMPAPTPSGARVAALQQARHASRATAPPQQARFHLRCCRLGAPSAAHRGEEHTRPSAPCGAHVRTAALRVCNVCVRVCVCACVRVCVCACV